MGTVPAVLTAFLVGTVFYGFSVKLFDFLVSVFGQYILSDHRLSYNRHDWQDGKPRNFVFKGDITFDVLMTVYTVSCTIFNIIAIWFTYRLIR